MAAFAALFLFCFAPGIAAARDYYVRESGRDSNDGRTPQTAWATLDRVFQESLAAGDVVYVGGGVYEIQQTVEAGGDNSSGTPRNGNDEDDRDRRRDDDEEDDERGRRQGRDRDDDDDDRRRDRDEEADDDDERRNRRDRDDDEDEEDDRRGRNSDRDEDDRRGRNSSRDDDDEDDHDRRSRSSRDDDDDDDRDREDRERSRNRNENGTSSENNSGRGSSRSNSNNGNSPSSNSGSNGNGGSGSSSNGNSSSGNNSGGNNSGSGTSGNSSAVMLIGDSTGRFTGDRGRVVLSPRSDGWCFAVSDFGTLAFDGFAFETSSRGSRPGNGVVATGANSRVTFSNCSFTNLKTAVVVQQGEVAVSGVTFNGVTTGIATEQAQVCEVRDCEFTSIGDWAIDSDAASTIIDQSTCAGRNGIRVGERSSQLAALSERRVPTVYAGLRISKRDAVITDVSVDGTGYGISAENLDSLAISGFSADGCSEWGVFASGTNLSLTGSTVTNGANGVSLSGTGNGQLATVASSTISGNETYGLLLNGVGFDFDTSRDLTVRDNGSFGLGIVGADLTLTNAAGFDLTGNGYGIYSARGNLAVSGLTLRGNGYGISQTEGQFVCRDVTITGSGTGLQHVNGTQLVIERTTVSGARDWGVHLQNDQTATAPNVELREVVLKDGANGVYAKLPTLARVSLCDSQLTGNSGYGLLASGAALQVERVSATKNQTGLQHTDGSLSIFDSVVSQNLGTGISVAGASASGLSSLTARRNLLTGNQRGISAWNVNAAVLVNNVLRGNSYGLQTQTTAGIADVWNNTLVDNQVGIYHAAGRSTVRNNLIVSGNGTVTVPNTVGIYSSRQGTLVLGNNLLFGQASVYSGTNPGAGDVLKPPRFVDYAGGDFRLAKGSPAINSGTTTGGLVTRDLAGVQRPMFEAFEIGAYEYPEKDGSVRIVEWTEKADAPKSLLKNVTGQLP